MTSVADVHVATLTESLPQKVIGDLNSPPDSGLRVWLNHGSEARARSLSAGVGCGSTCEV